MGGHGPHTNTILEPLSVVNIGMHENGECILLKQFEKKEGPDSSSEIGA